MGHESKWDESRYVSMLRSDILRKAFDEVDSDQSLVPYDEKRRLSKDIIAVSTQSAYCECS